MFLKLSSYFKDSLPRYTYEVFYILISIGVMTLPTAIMFGFPTFLTFQTEKWDVTVATDKIMSQWLQTLHFSVSCSNLTISLMQLDLKAPTNLKMVGESIICLKSPNSLYSCNSMDSLFLTTAVIMYFVSFFLLSQSL